MVAWPPPLFVKVTPVGRAPLLLSCGAGVPVALTWNVPSGNLNFPASVPGVNYHNWQAAVTPVSSIAHKGEVAGAKVLAASLLDLLTSPELIAKAKEQFCADTRDTPYFSFLPADAKPGLQYRAVIDWGDGSAATPGDVRLR